MNIPFYYYKNQSPWVGSAGTVDTNFAIIWNHKSNVNIANSEIIITFKDAAFSRNGSKDVKITLSNFEITKLIPEYNHDVLICADNPSFCLGSTNFIVDMDIKIEVIGASSSENLLLPIIDLDAPGAIDDKFALENWSESFGVSNSSFNNLGSPSINICVPDKSVVNEGYLHNCVTYGAHGTNGVSDSNMYKGSVSFLTKATATNAHWTGYNCLTALGINIDDFPHFKVRTNIYYETPSSPVNPGTRTYSNKFQKHIKTYPSILVPVSYSYTYPKTHIPLDTEQLAKYSGNNVAEKIEDWMVDYSDQTVSGDNINAEKTFDIYVNRKRFTYSFEANKPSGVAASVTGMPSNKTVVASNLDSGKSDATVSSPSLSGYKFIGWNTKADGTGDSYPGQEIMKTNKTFYAQWERNTYLVKFDANGSSNPNHQTNEYKQNTTAGSMSDQEMQYGVAANLNENKFSRAGYSFKNWNTKADGTGTSYSNKQSVTDIAGTATSITLYAQWTKLLGTETITVTDEITGDPVSGVTLKLQKKGDGDTSWTDIVSKTTAAGGTITVDDLHWFDYQWVMTGVPTGYRKVTSNTTFGIRYNNLEVDNAITLERIRYTVKYDDNHESNPNHIDGEFTQNTVTGTMADSTYIYGVAGTLRKNTYARVGYTFDGWNTKADGTGLSYPDEYDNVLNWTSTDGGTITLYAQWKKKLGTEKVTAVSEETGNPMPEVTMKLQWKMKGAWADVPNMSKETDDDGNITVTDLHWFEYRWVVTNVPAGYTNCIPTSYISPGTVYFTINYNQLSALNSIVIYMKHVTITIDSEADCIISGEDAPAFLYHISGEDAAGVNHQYNVLVQTSKDTKKGSSSVTGIFAGTYKITQTPVSRYVSGTALNVRNMTIGAEIKADVLNNLSAEVRFPYTLTNHGWYYGVDSKRNSLHTN